MIHGYISLSGLNSFLIVQNFANSAHPNVQPQDIYGREKNWPLLNDLYLLYIIYKRLFVGLSCIGAMMEQIVVHSFLLASLALLASLYCTLFYWLLCIGLSFSGLFCLASSLRFNSKSLF